MHRLRPRGYRNDSDTKSHPRAHRNQDTRHGYRRARRPRELDPHRDKQRRLRGKKHHAGGQTARQRRLYQLHHRRYLEPCQHNDSRPEHYLAASQHDNRGNHICEHHRIRQWLHRQRHRQHRRCLLGMLPDFKGKQQRRSLPPDIPPGQPNANTRRHHPLWRQRHHYHQQQRLTGKRHRHFRHAARRIPVQTRIHRHHQQQHEQNIPRHRASGLFSRQPHHHMEPIPHRLHPPQ